MITPLDYQAKGLRDIYHAFKQYNKVLYCLATAGGKTYVFSFLTQFWIPRYKKRVLVLCHRSELVDQTISSMNQIGGSCEKLVPPKTKLKHDSDCYVAMVETAYKRLQKNPYFFQNVGLIIVDECHIRVFEKIFNYFPGVKILGCTATPVVLSKVTFFKCKYCKSEYDTPDICCDMETQEWTKPFSMSMVYEHIILGPSIQTLIERGNLVGELSFVKDYADTDTLKTDSTGEFTAKSTDEHYSNDDAVFNVLLNYEELCLGKKTMIFNGTSKNNLMVYKRFIEAGYNVRMYDSVNADESGNRKELVKWFKDNDDAILLNVGCFTTGFDNREVQAIMLNFATASLSLFIQICGRGARSTDKIYKDHFILVDGGGNIDRHLEFSDPTRDWKKIFYEGLGKPKAKKQTAFDIESCEECGAIYAKSEPCCPMCGHVVMPPPKVTKEKSLSEDVMTPIRKIPPPNAHKIYEYTVRKGEDINFAFKIMISNYVDLFKYYRVSREVYESTLANGNLEKDVRKIIRKCYFFFINKPDIFTVGKRSIQYLVDKTLAKIKEYYYI